MHAKLKHKTRMSLNLLEAAIEFNNRNPKILEILERQLAIDSHFEFMDELCRIAEITRDHGFFNDRFYDQMFQYALRLVPVASVSDLVLFVKTFQDRESYVQEFVQ